MEIIHADSGIFEVSILFSFFTFFAVVCMVWVPVVMMSVVIGNAKENFQVVDIGLGHSNFILLCNLNFLSGVFFGIFKFVLIIKFCKFIIFQSPLKYFFLRNGALSIMLMLYLGLGFHHAFLFHNIINQLFIIFNRCCYWLLYFVFQFILVFVIAFQFDQQFDQPVQRESVKQAP